MVEGTFLDNSKLKDAKNITLIISPSQKKKILGHIGNSVDKKGYVTDINTKKRVFTPELEEIKANQLGAILPGSKIFLRKNLASFSQYLVNRKRKNK